MERKKSILFTIDSLTIGGAEKSLITLLGLLDYDKYDVDLQLFSYGRQFERFLPQSVNLLPPLSYSTFLKQSTFRQFLSPKKFIARYCYSLLIKRKGLTHADKARLYWKTIGRCIEKSNKVYDIAIAYAQDIPTFYTIDKIQAKRKLAWVNAFFNLRGENKEFQRYYYNSLDTIVLVSDSAYKFFSSEIYPEFSYKMRIFWDLIDSNTIKKMAALPADKPIDHSSPVIMTVGRLNKPQKGYDLALEAARILRDRGILFRWYAVGNGPYRQQMKQYIVDNHLEDHFILLGSASNPYNYMIQCDIYVQPSRFEGFGLTIAEAKLLNRPVVCASFETCSKHIRDGENGLIASFDPNDIADKIEMLLNDKELSDQIKSNLMNEVVDNLDSIESFYKLIKGEELTQLI